MNFGGRLHVSRPFLFVYDSGSNRVMTTDLKTLKTLLKVPKAQWLVDCHFHDLTGKQVLAEVEARAKKTPKPVVLLDLDSTLYEVARAAIRSSANGSRFSKSFVSEVKKILPA